MKKIALTILSLLLLNLFMLLGIHSYSVNHLTAQAQQTLQTRELKGTVNKIEGNRMVFEDSQGMQEVSIPENISLTRNGEVVSLSQLQPTDEVAITVGENNEVIAVTATPQARVNMMRTLLIGAVLLGIVLVALSLFMRRTQQPHIKTTPAPSM